MYYYARTVSRSRADGLALLAAHLAPLLPNIEQAESPEQAERYRAALAHLSAAAEALAAYAADVPRSCERSGTERNPLDHAAGVAVTVRVLSGPLAGWVVEVDGELARRLAAPPDSRTRSAASAPVLNAPAPHAQDRGDASPLRNLLDQALDALAYIASPESEGLGRRPRRAAETHAAITSALVASPTT